MNKFNNRLSGLLNYHYLLSGKQSISFEYMTP